jgi:DNA invertase Pin-like site-specific DNA recombinase
MDTKKPKVIAIYRVSTEEQAGEDRAGLPRQREAVARVVDQYDLDVISEIELAGVSGTNVSSSPEFREMLNKVRNREIEGVVVSSLDRLARPDTFESMAVLDNFTDAKASIYAEGEVINLATKEGKLTAQIKLAMHGFDRSNIVERSASAKEIKRKKGECPGPPSILPLGVSYDRKTNTWSYTKEIKIVKEAFRLFDKKKVTNLSHLANEVGLQRNTLAYILRNPLYKGWRIYDQKRSEDKHVVKNPRTPLRENETVRFSRKKVPRAEKDVIKVQVFKKPAVDPEMFDRVQDTLAENRCAFQRDKIPTEINLAVGIGHCAHCGRKLYASSGRRGEGRKNSPGYYQCANNHFTSKHKNVKCDQPNVRKAIIDSALAEFAAIHLASEPVIQALAQRLKDPVDNALSKENQEKRLKQIDQEKKRTVITFKKGYSSMEELDADMKKLNDEGSSIQRRLRSHDEQQRLRSNADRSVALLFKACLAFRSITTPAQKQAALRGLFAKVFFDGAKIVGFVPLDASLRPLPSYEEIGKVDDEGEGVMKGCIRLESPYAIESSEDQEPPVPDGHKRCRICKEVKSLDAFRVLTTKKGSWPYYACKECSKQLQKETYQRRKMKQKASQEKKQKRKPNPKPPKKP